MTNVGFNWAVTVGDVVRVVLLFYLMPAWTVLLAWPMLGEKPTPASLAAPGAGAGRRVRSCSRRRMRPGRCPRALADWLALAGGFSFALTNILLRKLHARAGRSRASLAMFGGGAVMAGAAALAGTAAGARAALRRAPRWPGPAWALALSLGFLAGNVALQYGAARLHAHATALIMLSEVLFASLSSVALGAANMNARTWIGGALILVAAVWSAWPAEEPQAPGLGAE